ncbi:DUF4062 domain-containing protein [Bacillus cereus]|uniref:DUF4062 domain-containing protein n=1 Tax=Bacillus cereus TaxID=1396 RepID=UPI0034D48C07
MQKKLQVFISSTFTDLQEERQVAVEAVLNSGHIPAGMELFKSGDTTQKEVIKKWIDESDVYMLILGGRYGSIDTETGKSYTHWEYDYAGEIGKPRFAIVIEEEALEQKVKDIGSHVMERENYPLYQAFRKQVLDKISKFFSGKTDIKLVVYESLKELERNEDLYGWISGKDIQVNSDLQAENYQLMKEVGALRKQLEKLETEMNKKNDLDGHSYEEVLECLKNSRIKIPKDHLGIKALDGKEISVVHLFKIFEEKFAVGISNSYGMKTLEQLLFFNVAPHLLTFGLVEKVKMAQGVQRIQTSKVGLKFLRLTNLKKIENEKSKQAN